MVVVPSCSGRGGRVSGSQGRRAGWAGCLGVCRAAGRNGSAQMKQQMGGREWVVRGSLGNLGRRLQHCVELVPVPTTDLRLEITRKGPLRCVRWLPPAFENVSPNLRSKPSKPSKHSRASTHRHKNALTLVAAHCWLVGRVQVLTQYSHLSPVPAVQYDPGHAFITWATSRRAVDPVPHC